MQSSLSPIPEIFMIDCLYLILWYPKYREPWWKAPFKLVYPTLCMSVQFSSSTMKPYGGTEFKNNLFTKFDKFIMISILFFYLLCFKPYFLETLFFMDTSINVTTKFFVCIILLFIVHVNRIIFVFLYSIHIFAYLDSLIILSPTLLKSLPVVYIDS